MPKLVTPSLIFLITIDRFWSQCTSARACKTRHIVTMVLATPAELGHALLHATRYIYYLLIHIDILTLTIKIKI